jgi:hypothetical protein
MKPSSRRVLRAFLAAPGRTLSTHQLGQPEVGGFRFGARLKELREEGCEIEAHRVSRGGWNYTLRSWPTELDAGAVANAGVEPGGNDAPAGSIASNRDGSDPARAISSPGPGGALALFPREKPPHDREAA